MEKYVVAAARPKSHDTEHFLHWSNLHHLVDPVRAVVSSWIGSLEVSSPNELYNAVSAGISIITRVHECQYSYHMVQVVDGLEAMESDFRRFVLPWIASEVRRQTMKIISKCDLASSLPELRFRSHPSINQGSRDTEADYDRRRVYCNLQYAYLRLARSLAQGHKGLVGQALLLAESAEFNEYIINVAQRQASPRNRADFAISRNQSERLLQHELIQIVNLTSPAQLQTPTFFEFGLVLVSQVAPGYECIVNDILQYIVFTGHQADSSELPPAIRNSFFKAVQEGPLDGYYVDKSRAALRMEPMDEILLQPRSADQSRYVSLFMAIFAAYFANINTFHRLPLRPDWMFTPLESFYTKHMDPTRPQPSSAELNEVRGHVANLLQFILALEKKKASSLMVCINNTHTAIDSLHANDSD